MAELLHSLRLPMGRGLLLLALGLALPCLSQAQFANSPAMDVYPGMESHALRLSRQLEVRTGGKSGADLFPSSLPGPAAGLRIDPGRQAYPAARAESEAAMDNVLPAFVRRFVPPPGELNTTGVVRAGRLSIQDGVPVLQRDDGASTPRILPVQGARVEN
jgi:hypothetical protein